MKNCLLRLMLIVAVFVGFDGERGTVFAQESVLEVVATSGAKLRTLLTGDPSTAKANVMLLAGGSGVLKISGKGNTQSKNFLVRNRQSFAAAGFLAAVVDAPMDRRKKPGLLGGFRASEEHAADLEKVARKLQELNGKPVIVVGTSRGSVSAANLALRDKSGVVKAAVITSSLVKPNNRGKTLHDLALSELKLPLLFVHNKSDKCKVTLLKDVEPLFEKLRNSGVSAELIVVDSTEKTGRYCGAGSPHGYLGIEQDVISRIAGWIQSKI